MGSNATADKSADKPVEKSVEADKSKGDNAETHETHEKVDAHSLHGQPKSRDL